VAEYYDKFSIIYLVIFYSHISKLPFFQKQVAMHPPFLFGFKLEEWLKILYASLLLLLKSCVSIPLIKDS
jgi:hypothetical protein